ncbi:hypothetical protein [Polynucleobacter sp. Fuers-14]|uniref:hypothetical protein n=1 Tax=Polynucleobacter sp. Fuers-14 TaxID=1758364 RepID=UPI001C0C7182|nr:hypothetical protein [Polynucleobacter sp. Fuers-14]MBU3640538.1 hypothetical protein [Polynucleobacter sp. Fuers-14]
MNNLFSKAEEIKKSDDKQIRNALLVCTLIAIGLAVVLNLTGCAASATQKQDYAVYFNCLVAQARQADDKRSDAVSIAMAIQNMCIQDLNNVSWSAAASSGQARREVALNAVLYARNHPK